jgi:hypothetical protein
MKRTQPKDVSIGVWGRLPVGSSITSVQHEPTDDTQPIGRKDEVVQS